MDFLKVVCGNTLLYKALLRFLETEEPKFFIIKDKNRRFDILLGILSDRLAQMTE